MTEKAMTAVQEPKNQPVSEQNHREDYYLTPPVDITETDDELTIVLDLPGVEKEDIVMRIENGILSVQAHTPSKLPGEIIHREYRSASFYRQFRISDEVDSNAIQAVVKHGVLTVSLPKLERAKPQRIEIKTA